MTSTSKIYVAGHRGMVGSAIWRALERQGFTRLIGQNPGRTGFAGRRRRPMFLRGGKTGICVCRRGQSRRHPGQPHAARQFLYENLQIQNNLIHNARLAGVKKLLFLGSSCIYPKLAPQPMQGGIPADRPVGADQPMVCRRQNCRHQTVPGLPPPIRLQFHQRHAHQPLRNQRHLRFAHFPCPAGADPQIPPGQEFPARPSVTCWGTGAPLREFLHADDLAAACVFLMRNYSEEQFINIGFGSDLTILELAERVKRVVGFQGEILWDTLQTRRHPAQTAGQLPHFCPGLETPS